MQSSSSRGKLSAGSSSPRTGVTAAAYGHACTNCAKAKCKCIYSQAGRVCERCSRLSKQCQPSVPNRKRNPRKAPGSRTAHLEEKLDDLVSLIRSQALVKASAADSILPATSPTAGNSLAPAGPSTGSPALASSKSSPNATSPVAINSEGSITDATSPESGSTTGDYDYHVAEDVAEDCLVRFRRDMICFCPIVYVPPTSTARQLRQSRPCLWLSIMACTTRSMKQAHEIGDRLRHIIAQKIVLGFERNVDILQGLIVFLQWPHCHRKDQPFLSLWTNIGVSLAQDLGFSTIKGETAFTYIKKFWVPKTGCKLHQQQNQRIQSQDFTVEDRRTMLALFVWTSTVSHIIRRDNNLRWTPFLEESLRMLIERPEWEGDLILTTQIRCHLLTQQITDISIQQALLNQDPRIPIHFHQSLVAQLTDIWRTIPPRIAQHEAVLLHLHGTEVSIQELALSFDPPSSTGDTLKQLDALQKCLNAVVSWFQIWERVPPAQLIGLTFNTFTQKIQGIVALLRLSTVDSIPAWNTTEVRKTMDIFALLDRIAIQMDSAAAAIPVAEDDPGEDSIWTKAAMVMRRIKKGLKEDFPDMGQNVGTEQVPDMVIGGGISQDLHNPFLPNFADDPWLSGIFAPWESMNF